MSDALALYIFRGGHKGRGEWLLRRAIGMYAEEKGAAWLNAEERLSFKKTKNGKPYLEGLPVAFSVSHTGKLWGCLIGRDNVGLDIQEKRGVDFMKLAERFFLDEEIEYIRGNGADAFFDVWVRKEAAVKYFDTGMLGDMKAFSVVAGGRPADRIDHERGACFVNQFELLDAVKCAFCSSVRGVDIWIQELD